MTELEKDLLANGFSEKDLKKFRRARERAKQDEQFEGDNDLDYDFTLRREINILGSCFAWFSSAILCILILLNTSGISEGYTLWRIIQENLLTIIFTALILNLVIPLSLGFKSWRYKRIKKKKK
ncbi:hypothetical protein [Erwinia sp. JH02]|uniref:hypothetical protein n=1 Tax=Erwinia sp. JH02 TaxID=2733394 RepID=UPI001489C369|nr:hypothetical protein [Erwinia sp. JH02]NNS06715.1 hypothetical protein [Erwinia sp. JH02]